MKEYHKIGQGDVGYLAGLIDGEGCICISAYKSPHHSKQCYRASIQIGTTSKDPLDWVASTFGGKLYVVKPHKYFHKTSYQWTMRAGDAAKLLKVALPYLKVKSRQASNLILFSKTVKGATGRKGLDATTKALRKSIYEDNRQLNQKGAH